MRKHATLTIVLGAFLASILLITGCGKPMFTARTTLMEIRPAGSGPSPFSFKNLCLAGKSKNVIDRTYKKITASGITISRQQLLDCLRVEPVKNTNIICIEATRANEHEARVIAQTACDEFKAVYVWIQTKPKAPAFKGVALRTIDPVYTFKSR